MTPLFRERTDKAAYLHGCPTKCGVYERDGVLYANTGPLLRRLTPCGDGLKDSDERLWEVVDACRK